MDFAPDFVRPVFERGAFGEVAVLPTANALRGISVGLRATTLGWILIRIINSSGRNRAAAGIQVAGYAANMAANALLVGWFGSLGLGETARGLVMLVGSVIVLGAGGLFLRNLLIAAPVACGLALAGSYVTTQFDAPLTRLLVAAPALALTLAVAVAFWFAFHLPAQSRVVLAGARGIDAKLVRPFSSGR